MDEREYHVYIMMSLSGVLYIGITNNLARRVHEHKNGAVAGFTDKYRCNLLVYCEAYQYVDQAIAREKQLKNWNRGKKIGLIEMQNPKWGDLSEEWFPDK